MATPNSTSFHLRINNREVGPLDRNQVRDLFAQKKIGRATPCRLANSNEWLSVYDLVPSALWGAESSAANLEQTNHNANAPGKLSRIAYLSLAVICSVGALFLFFYLIAAVVPSGPLTPQHSPRTSGFFVPPCGNLSSSNNSREAVDSFETLTNLVAGIFRLGIMGMLAMFLLSIVAFGLWVWMLTYAATKELPGPDKITWVLIIVLTGPIGAIIYFFARFLARPSNAPPPLPQSHPRSF